MLNVEFLPNEEEGIDIGRNDIIVNEIRDTSSVIFEFKDALPIVRISHFDVIEELNRYSFNDVSKYLSRYEYNTNFEWTSEETSIEISLGEEPKINLFVKPDLIYWAKPWSFVIFENEFRKVLKNFHPKIEPGTKFLKSEKGYGIKIEILDGDSIITQSVQTCHNILQKIYKATELNLTNEINKDSLTSIFEFPQEIKSACKQYLVYFAQFLSDLGINAETEIKEETDKTLFKVTPKDKTDALEKIKKILDTYLQMAESTSIELMNMYDSNVAVQQLKANIHHLQGQLYLSKSVMQMKDATIESLQLSNFQLKERVEILNKEKSKKEDIIPGVVAVKEYDGKGFSIDIPNIVRSLKRRFTKEDK